MAISASGVEADGREGIDNQDGIPARVRDVTVFVLGCIVGKEP
jgi:hypothetical protein